MPITVRTLETMIRLATSHAKLRLSKSVEPSDIDIVCTILNNSIFQEDIKPVKDEPESSDDEEDKYDDDKIKVNTNNSRATRMAARTQQVKTEQQPSPAKKPVKKEEKTPAKSTNAGPAAKKKVEKK